MAEEKKVETLQDDIKLLKGEIKQSLASVRDYLLNMELPSSEFSTILAALGSDGNQKVTIDGSIANALGNKAAEAAAQGAEEVETTKETTEEQVEDDLETPPEDEDLLDMEKPLREETEMLSEDDSIGQEEDLPSDDSQLVPEDAFEGEEFSEPDEIGESDELDEQGEITSPQSEIPAEEEQPVDYEKITAVEAESAIPKVNMLANLINWVARAKKEIGQEQLTTFLEVYGISGHLTPELKELIIHLSEISAEHPEVANNAEVWSQTMLLLHGILTGGDAPLHPVSPSWSESSSEAELTEEEEIIEVDKNKESPVKLKLVFPNGDGKSKEFCIDLNPEESKDDPPKKRKK